MSGSFLELYHWVEKRCPSENADLGGDGGRKCKQFPLKCKQGQDF